MKNNTPIEKPARETATGILFDFWKEYSEAKDSKTRDRVIEKHITKLEQALTSAYKAGQEDVKKQVEELSKNYKCGACDSKTSNLSHTMLCDFINKIQDNIKNKKVDTNYPPGGPCGKR